MRRGLDIQRLETRHQRLALDSKLFGQFMNANFRHSHLRRKTSTPSPNGFTHSGINLC
jgi:hypothetical protein